MTNKKSTISNIPSNKIDSSPNAKIEVSNTPKGFLKSNKTEALRFWQNWYKNYFGRNNSPNNIDKIGQSIIMIIIYILISIYIYKLESQKCVCAITWEQKVIKVLNVIYIIDHFVTICFFRNPGAIRKNSAMHTLFLMSYVLYLYCLYTYTNYLKFTNCRCAIKKNRSLYLFTNSYIKFIIFSIIIMVIIGGTVGIIYVIKFLTSKRL